MGILEAVVLAFVQGFTEFLPISSSGHLILFPAIFGWETQDVAFDLIVHLGTLTAVVVSFRQELTSLFLACIKFLQNRELTTEIYLIIMLFVATLPAVIVGFFLQNAIDNALRAISVIICTTVLYAVLMFFANQKVKTNTLKEMTFTKAILMGLSQALALIPGTSRSGVTITMGLFLGLDIKTATRFSFLMSIPVILGAVILKVPDAVHLGHIEILPLAIGYVVSFLVALLTITFFMKTLNRFGLLPYVIYRFFLAFILFYIFWV